VNDGLTPEPGPPAPVGGRIMVVEDDEGIRLSMARTLEDEGYEITTAANGAEALRLLEQADELPGLLLLDLMMPVMDGTTFRREQLARPRLAGIPVVVLTAHGSAEQKAAELGVPLCLVKPMPLEALLDAVVLLLLR
jgi:two-component system, chemotaxis family, chemotaxis protein CheY